MLVSDKRYIRTDKKIDHQTQPTVSSVGGYAESHIVIM